MGKEWQDAQAEKKSWRVVTGIGSAVFILYVLSRMDESGPDWVIFFVLGWLFFWGVSQGLVGHWLDQRAIRAENEQLLISQAQELQTLKQQMASQDQAGAVRSLQLVRPEPNDNGERRE